MKSRIARITGVGLAAALLPIAGADRVAAVDEPPQPDRLAVCYEYDGPADNTPDAFRFGVVPGRGWNRRLLWPGSAPSGGRAVNVEVTGSDGSAGYVDYSADAELAESSGPDTIDWSSVYTGTRGKVTWKVNGDEVTANLSDDPASSGDRLECPSLLDDADGRPVAPGGRGRWRRQHQRRAAERAAGWRAVRQRCGRRRRAGHRPVGFIGRSRFIDDPDLVGRSRFIVLLIGRSRFIDDPDLVGRSRFIDAATIGRSRFIAVQTLGRSRFIAEAIGRSQVHRRVGRGPHSFHFGYPLSSLQPSFGSTWDDILADTTSSGSNTNDVLLSDVAARCGTEINGDESWVPFCESSIFDIDLDNQLLSEISLISLMFGETTLANIPAPNGASSWCGAAGRRRQPRFVR